VVNTNRRLFPSHESKEGTLTVRPVAVGKRKRHFPAERLRTHRRCCFYVNCLDINPGHRQFSGAVRQPSSSSWSSSAWLLSILNPPCLRAGYIRSWCMPAFKFVLVFMAFPLSFLNPTTCSTTMGNLVERIIFDFKARFQVRSGFHRLAPFGYSQKQFVCQSLTRPAASHADRGSYCGELG